MRGLEGSAAPLAVFRRLGLASASRFRLPQSRRNIAPAFDPCPSKAVCSGYPHKNTTRSGRVFMRGLEGSNLRQRFWRPL